MRVYFAANGIGLGHVGRVVPIARKLLEKNTDLLFSTYEDGVRYVESEKLPLVKAPPLGMKVRTDGSIDFRQTAVNPGPFLGSLTILRQINAELGFIGGFEPDVVVSDSRLSSLLAAGLLRRPRVCILNQFQIIIPRRRHHLYLARLADSITLTLVGKMWTSGNIVLIPDFPPPNTVSSGNLNIPKSYQRVIKLIGPILAVHPERLGSKEELRHKLGLPLDKPVIFVPVSGPAREKAVLIDALRNILLGFPKDYEIVMSQGYPNSQRKPLHYSSLTIYPWIPNRFEFLKACDIVISRAGHGTITQSMFFGKPMLLIPTSGHTEQINNAKKAMDLGIAKILPQKDLEEKMLLKMTGQIMKDGSIQKAAKIQQEVSNYNGLDQAVNVILELGDRQTDF